jgi:hypothetical protein
MYEQDKYCRLHIYAVFVSFFSVVTTTVKYGHDYGYASRYNGFKLYHGRFSYKGKGNKTNKIKGSTINLKQHI